MTELLTAAQMRAVEQAAIARGAVSGLELMERAGRGVVDAVFGEWPELASGRHRAVVLCGPGNNGGDGFVVARLLHDAGWDVDVFLYGIAVNLPPDASANYEQWIAVGTVRDLTDQSFETYAADLNGAAIVVDALFGTGLTRPFHDLGAVQGELNYYGSASPSHSAPRVVSIDIPSGVCSDSGKFLGFKDQSSFDFAILANLTVTFHRAKTGHVLAQGPQASHRLVVVDIGLDDAAAAQPDVDVVNAATVEPTFLRKHGQGHKFSHGHALVLSGGSARTGAARLAARGALRIGAGVVTLGVPPAAQMEVASKVTAIMINRISDAEALDATLKDERITALCLGPAFGLGLREAAIVATALRNGAPSRQAGAQERALCVVLDADALTLLADDAQLFAMLHAKCVLTPHAGEFARLFPDIAERLVAPATTGPAYSKVNAARDAAKRAGCTIVFKGPDTVIASPDGRCSINDSTHARAAPWLATAGSGDVLAGFITGLLARGLLPYQAAQAGAFLHTECALGFGAGLVAEDLPEELPKVLKTLLL